MVLKRRRKRKTKKDKKESNKEEEKKITYTYLIMSFTRKKREPRSSTGHESYQINIPEEIARAARAL